MRRRDMKRKYYLFSRSFLSVILILTMAINLSGCAAAIAVGAFFAKLGEGVGKVASSVGDWVQKGKDYVKPMVDKGKEVAKKYEDAYKAGKELYNNGKNVIEDVKNIFEKGDQKNGGSFNTDPNREATDEIDFPSGGTRDEMDTFRAVEKSASSFRKNIDGFARRIHDFPSELKSRIQKDLDGINQGLQAVSNAGKATSDVLKQFEQAVSGIERVNKKIQEQENYAKGLNSGLEALIPSNGNNPAPLTITREALEKRAQEVEANVQVFKRLKDEGVPFAKNDWQAFSDAGEAFKRALNDRSAVIQVTATKSEIEKADKKLEAARKEWEKQDRNLNTIRMKHDQTLSEKDIKGPESRESGLIPLPNIPNLIEKGGKGFPESAIGQLDINHQFMIPEHCPKDLYDPYLKAFEEYRKSLQAFLKGERTLEKNAAAEKAYAKFRTEYLNLAVASEDRLYKAYQGKKDVFVEMNNQEKTVLEAIRKQGVDTTDLEKLYRDARSVLAEYNKNAKDFLNAYQTMSEYEKIEATKNIREINFRLTQALEKIDKNQAEAKQKALQQVNQKLNKIKNEKALLEFQDFNKKQFEMFQKWGKQMLQNYEKPSKDDLRALIQNIKRSNLDSNTAFRKQQDSAVAELIITARVNDDFLKASQSIQKHLDHPAIKKLIDEESRDLTSLSDPVQILERKAHWAPKKEEACRSL
jgi:hypothetical protein